MRTIVVAILNKPKNFQLVYLPTTFTHPTLPGVRFIVHSDPQEEIQNAHRVSNYDYVIDMREAGEPRVQMVLDMVSRYEANEN